MRSRTRGSGTRGRGMVTASWSNRMGLNTRAISALISCMARCVSFAKEPYKRDNILQKRPVIWSAISALMSCMVRCVSFAKEPYKRDNILQKRPVTWSAISALMSCMVRCACLCERARERETHTGRQTKKACVCVRIWARFPLWCHSQRSDGERERERENNRERVCVCVCACVRGPNAMCVSDYKGSTRAALVFCVCQNARAVLWHRMLCQNTRAAIYWGRQYFDVMHGAVCLFCKRAL